MDHQICFRLNAMLLKALVSVLDERRLMSETDVAEIFDVGPRTVRRWRNSGYIGYYWLEGGDVRYSLDQVNRRKAEMERTLEIRGARTANTSSA
jgi:predicted site-specific integrase-resolvase